MIMDTDTVETCLLATGDERGEIRQRSSHRDSEIDADPGHVAKAPSFSSVQYGASSGMRTEPRLLARASTGGELPRCTLRQQWPTCDRFSRAPAACRSPL